MSPLLFEANILRGLITSLKNDMGMNLQIQIEVLLTLDTVGVV